jgi:hypothetical protein
VNITLHDREAPPYDRHLTVVAPVAPQLQEVLSGPARTRRRVLALFLPLAAAFFMAAEGLDPRGTDVVVQDTATAFKVLPIAATHPTQLFVAGALSLLALGALAVSFAAIATLVRARGATVATVAALIGGVAAFGGIVTNVLVDFNLGAAATAHLSRAAAAQFLIRTFDSGFVHPFEYVYFVGVPVATALMAFALWRGRAVPRWLALLFLVGLEVAFQVSSLGPLVVVALMAPFAVAMVLLSIRIWRTAGRSAGGPKAAAARL